MFQNLLNNPFRNKITAPAIGSFCIAFSLFLLPTISNAQDDNLGTEVVNIVKPYTPTISDAFKVKETPSLSDSVDVQKKPVKYGIFSVPVASTFTPAKGKAATVEKAKPMKLYDNYATLGFGNFTTILGELYSNVQVSRTDNFGVFFKHNSSQGGIDDIRLENKYYDTQLDANYTSRQRDMSYSANVGFEHQLYNWYGLPSNFDPEPFEVINAIDPEQSYISGYIGGAFSLDDSFFEKVTATIRYSGDAFSSSEFNIQANPQFAFPVEQFTLQVDGEIDFLSGKFARDYSNFTELKYNFLNAGIAPSLVYVDNDLTLSLGVAAYVGLDTENSTSDFFIYPRVNASYRLVDELLIAYGGAEGGLHQNTYYNFRSENPFISPTQNITPTSQLYDGFAGLKGKLSNSVGYNLRASYGNEENKALFKLNPYKGMNPVYLGYENGNSFQVVYDDINTLAVFGELKVEVSEKFSLGVNGTFYSYSVTNEDEAWNLPELEASVFSNFNITEKIYGGASLFFVGERKDQLITAAGIPNTLNTVQTVTLDGYVDANLHLGYRVGDRLSIFVKGSNLLSNNYEKWLNYPVQGIQGLLGATYKFDW